MQSPTGCYWSFHEVLLCVLLWLAGTSLTRTGLLDRKVCFRTEVVVEAVLELWDDFILALYHARCDGFT